jgi:hypothetical protein
VIESFDTSASVDILSIDLDDSVDSCDLDGILDSGETGQVTVQVANKGPVPMTDTTVTVSSSTPGVVFPGSPSATIPTVAPYDVVTVAIDIGLDSSVTTMTVLDLTVTVDNDGSCVASTVDSRTPLVHLDEVAKASATETVEVRDPPWSTNGTPMGAWTRVETSPGEHAWHGADSGSTGDVKLVSPILRVAATGPLVITLDQAYSFEFSGGIYWDGGVIEISSDGGATWQDVSAFDDPGYDGVITDTSGNPLAGRNAFGGTNPSYPATDPLTLRLGTGFDGQNIRIRFRIGTDAAVGAPGWTIDNIAVSGITNTPFGVVVDDDGVCAP